MSFVDVHVNINDKFSAFWMYRFLGAPQILVNNSDEGAIFEDRWRAAANLLQFFTSHWLLTLPTSDQLLLPRTLCLAHCATLHYLPLHTPEAHLSFPLCTNQVCGYKMYKVACIEYHGRSTDLAMHCTWDSVLYEVEEEEAVWALLSMG